MNRIGSPALPLWRYALLRACPTRLRQRENGGVAGWVDDNEIDDEGGQEIFDHGACAVRG